jgi:hypothetical protein
MLRHCRVRISTALLVPEVRAVIASLQIAIPSDANQQMSRGEL